MALNWRSNTGGLGRALRHADFRAYWFLFFISSTARWMQRVAVQWLAWQLTESAAWLGIVAFAETFPVVVFSLWGGAISDRIGNMRMVRLVNLSTAILIGLFAYLAFIGEANIWVVVFLTAAIGSVHSFGSGAMLAIVNQLVPKEDLAAALALNSATFNASRFVGPALAGLTIATLGVPATIAAGAVGLFLFTIVLFRLRVAPGPVAGSKSAGITKDILEGLRYINAHVSIRFLMILMGVTAMLIRPYMELLAGFADDVFGRDADGLAILLSATGFGGVFGGVWLTLRGRIEGLSYIVVLSMLISAVGMIAFSATELIWFAAASAVCVGFFMLTGNIASQTLIQSAVDPAVRGRVMAVFVLVSWGIPAFGALLMGWIADHAGLQLTIGAGGLATAFIWIWARARTERTARALEDRSAEAISAPPAAAAKAPGE